MFERIKCYRRLKRVEKILRGFNNTGILPKEMTKDINEALKLSATMKIRIIFNQKLAKQYNSEFERQGLK